MVSSPVTSLAFFSCRWAEGLGGAKHRTRRVAQHGTARILPATVVASGMIVGSPLCFLHFLYAYLADVRRCRNPLWSWSFLIRIAMDSAFTTCRGCHGCRFTPLLLGCVAVLGLHPWDIPAMHRSLQMFCVAD